MKRLIFAVVLILPTIGLSDTQGMVLRINCGTLIDATNGDMPITISMQNYINGLMDGIAVSNGSNTPTRLLEIRERVLAACKEDQIARVHTVIKDDALSK